MNLNANFIVYMWLFPVVSSIILPLGMLAVWLTQRGVKAVLGIGRHKEGIEQAVTVRGH